MPRVIITPQTVALKVSAGETYDWAHRPGAAWPCSALSGNRFTASFDRNGLWAMTVNGHADTNDYGIYPGGIEVSGDELSAICADMLRDRLPRDHPAYYVAVEQFD